MRRISSSVRLDLPAPPVPVMPSTGTLLSLACLVQGLQELGIGLAVLERGDQLRERAPCRFAVPGDRIQLLRRVHRQVVVASHHHLADHPGEPHALAVLGAVDARDAIGLQVADLRRHDHAAAAAEDLDVLAAALL